MTSLYRSLSFVHVMHYHCYDFLVTCHCYDYLVIHHRFYYLVTRALASLGYLVVFLDAVYLYVNRRCASRHFLRFLLRSLVKNSFAHFSAISSGHTFDAAHTHARTHARTHIHTCWPTQNEYRFRGALAHKIMITVFVLRWSTQEWVQAPSFVGPHIN